MVFLLLFCFVFILGIRLPTIDSLPLEGSLSYDNDKYREDTVRKIDYPLSVSKDSSLLKSVSTTTTTTTPNTTTRTTDDDTSSGYHRTESTTKSSTIIKTIAENRPEDDKLPSLPSNHHLRGSLSSWIPSSSSGHENSTRRNPNHRSVASIPVPSFTTPVVLDTAATTTISSSSSLHLEHSTDEGSRRNILQDDTSTFLVSFPPLLLTNNFTLLSANTTISSSTSSVSTSFWIGTITGISFISLVSTAIICSCGTNGLRIITNPSTSTPSTPSRSSNDTVHSSTTTTTIANQRTSTNTHANTTTNVAANNNSLLMNDNNSSSTVLTNTTTHSNTTNNTLFPPPSSSSSSSASSTTTLHTPPRTTHKNQVFSRQTSLINGLSTPTMTNGLLSSRKQPTHQIVPLNSNSNDNNNNGKPSEEHGKVSTTHDESKFTEENDKNSQKNHLWFASLDPIRTYRNGVMTTDYDRALPGIHGTPLPPNLATKLQQQQIHPPQNFNFDPIPHAGEGNGLLTVSQRKLPPSVFLSENASSSSSSSPPGSKVFTRDSKRYIRTVDGSIVQLSMYDQGEQLHQRINNNKNGQEEYTDSDSKYNNESVPSSPSPSASVSSSKRHHQFGFPPAASIDNGEKENDVPILSSSSSSSFPVTTDSKRTVTEISQPELPSVQRNETSTNTNPTFHHNNHPPNDKNYNASRSSVSLKESNNILPVLPSHSNNLRPMVRPLLQSPLSSKVSSKAGMNSRLSTNTNTSYHSSTNNDPTVATSTTKFSQASHYSSSSSSTFHDDESKDYNPHEEHEDGNGDAEDEHDHRYHPSSQYHRASVDPRYTMASSDSFSQYESKYDDNNYSEHNNNNISPLRRGKLPLNDDSTITNTNNPYSSSNSRASTNHSNPLLTTPRTPRTTALTESSGVSQHQPSLGSPSTITNDLSNTSTTLPLYKQLFAKEAGKTLSAEAFASAAQGQVEALLNHIAALEAAMIPGAVPLHAQMEINQLQQRNEELVQRVNSAESKFIEAENTKTQALTRAQDAETRAITAEMLLKDTQEKLNAATRRIVSLEKLTAAFGVRGTVRPVVLPSQTNHSGNNNGTAIPGSPENMTDYYPTTYPNSVVPDNGMYSASSVYPLSTPNNGYFATNTNNTSLMNNLFPVTGNSSYGVVSNQPTSVPSLSSRPTTTTGSLNGTTLQSTVNNNSSSNNNPNSSINGLYALGHSQSQLLPTSMYLTSSISNISNNNNSSNGNSSWVPPAINTQQLTTVPSLISPLLSNGPLRSSNSNGSGSNGNKFSPDGLVINATLAHSSKSSLGLPSTSPSRSYSTVPSARGRSKDTNSYSFGNDTNVRHSASIEGSNNNNHQNVTKKSRPKSAGANTNSSSSSQLTGPNGNPILSKSVYSSSAEAAASVYRTLPTPMPMLSPEVYGPPRSPNRTNGNNRSNNQYSGVTRYTLGTNTSEVPPSNNNSLGSAPTSPSRNGLFYSNLGNLNNQHHPLKTQSQWTNSHIQHLPMEQYSLPHTSASTTDASHHVSSKSLSSSSSSLLRTTAKQSSSFLTTRGNGSNPISAHQDDTRQHTSQSNNSNNHAAASEEDVNLPKNRKGRIVLEGKQFAPRRTSRSGTEEDGGATEESDSIVYPPPPSQQQQPYLAYPPPPQRNSRSSRTYDNNNNNNNNPSSASEAESKVSSNEQTYYNNNNVRQRSSSRQSRKHREEYNRNENHDHHQIDEDEEEDNDDNQQQQSQQNTHKGMDAHRRSTHALYNDDEQDHDLDENDDDYPQQRNDGNQPHQTSSSSSSRNVIPLPPSQLRKAESRAKAVEFLDTYRSNSNNGGNPSSSSSPSNTTTNNNPNRSVPSSSSMANPIVPMTKPPSSLSSVITVPPPSNTSSSSSAGTTTGTTTHHTVTKRLSITTNPREDETHIAAVQAAKTGNTQLLGLQSKSNSWRLV